MTNFNKIKLSIVIVNYNSKELLEECLNSIYQSGTKTPYEIIVVDNASVDGSGAMVEKKFPKVRLIKNSTNLGFTKANNQGFHQAKGEYIFILNNDTIIKPGAIDILINFLDTHSQEVAVAPKLLNKDGTFQRSFFEFPNVLKIFLQIIGFSTHLLNSPKLRPFCFWISRLPGFRLVTIKDEPPTSLMKVPYVILAALMIKKEALFKIGLLDENFFLYHDDCDLGYRMRKAGFNVWWLSQSQIIHIGGGTTKKIALEAYQHYYRYLIYLFFKHESKLSQLLLRMSIFFGFLWRTLLTPFGFYSQIEIPSTYKNKSSNNKLLNRYSLIDRIKVYFRIMIMALRPSIRK